MSAAEKLKGLDTLTLKNEHNVPIRSLTVAEQLVDALPQIVALVEAAESAVLLEYDPARHQEINDELGRRAAALRAALAALDEALGDVT